ncbi:pre-60S factor REI1 [Nematocida sp. LUAm3]|nr:pre-60S factor REI1 [Nematocida sp. LUAm3]KAI5175184.1 pre-60S factor REI1 [Nematocida sp. LUAm2]KAI5178144.1 pre-60S factor REI1 [Nematocida sp. LUAm1]
MKCRTCSIEIEKEQVTYHYTSDLHAENLRRKEANIPSISQNEWIEQQQKQEIDSKKQDKRTISPQKEETGTYLLKTGECFFCDELIDTSTQPFFMDVSYLKHLHTHGFKLLLSKYITNVYGLLSYLKDKIERCVCLCCNKRFCSIIRVRAHMVTLFHTRYTNSEEYDAFYTYPEAPQAYVITDGAELLLPSGRVAGNKKYTKYFTQTLREEGYYKSLDPIGNKFEEIRVQKRQDIPQTQEEKIQLEKFLERSNKHHLRVSQGSNKQKHYREDWMQ